MKSITKKAGVWTAATILLACAAAARAEVDNIDVLSSADQQDARGRYYKVHVVRFPGNCVYQIDLKSRDFDTYLRIEDVDGNPLAEDDDGGEGLNSRLFWTPPRTGWYRVIVTSFRPRATGLYRLTVTP